jgi:hypothetical protein
MLIDQTIISRRKSRLIQHCFSFLCSSFPRSANVPIHKTLHNLIQTIKNHSDQHGRVLSTAFQALPSKVDYPDYYEIIQRPIDLRRIESRQYSSIEELSSDLQLMFDNACLYNEPGSTIYRVRFVEMCCHFDTFLVLRMLFLCKTFSFIKEENTSTHNLMYRI